jgi:dipeptidyl aminopeptidase/acylaminoacyl peptidase
VSVRRSVLVLACAFFTALAPAQEAFLEPNANLVVDGIPPISAGIAKAVAPYSAFRPSELVDWHPKRREILVLRRHTNTRQVHVVSEPGAKPEPLTDFADAVSGASFHPDGEAIEFSRGTGGDEVLRRFRHELATKAVTPLTPEGERASGFAWSPDGSAFAYALSAIDRNNPDRTARTTLYLAESSRPEAAKVLARFQEGVWSGWRFSPDGRMLAFLETRASEESRVWILELKSGRRWALTREERGAPVAYASPRWARDSRGLYALSDRGAEFRRLVYLPVTGGGERVVAGHPHDIDSFAVSFYANNIAYTTNEHGAHVLRFLDLSTGREMPRPPLFDGVIGALHWRPDSAEVGFTIASARTAGDVFSFDLKANQLTRWTNGNNPAVNTSTLVEPRTIRWKSFDGREISGLHYAPGESFKGKRPVIVEVHGGPASQARAGFLGRNNYFLNEMGIALIYPNVRGSSGFGKSFLGLDNGRLREDSVKDLGALIDWIRAQPDLDGERILVAGGSYGGYMALAASVLLGERISGAVSRVGISNFVTFLERTESYRRDHRRREYGDERDPAMRKFLESIAPVNRVERITKPLFVVQGLNDPRVPHTEAEQIVASLKARGSPVWFLLARDEGHGFAKRDNADFLFAATVEFARRTLLGQSTGDSARQ